mmetsp:Transcript_8610/g.15198  ORF Transcript_8610/g.15198 Transcript_8610/m.15198 type:complete len:322 (-) Transcript_8610:120-1085(-)|eukprot:CAMPEP_0201894046 /NCGR_PEP_ID=MMETSP0902-20130614/39952_1 /ASSEMBLY_ACC=CAM_ASM_000551 /TAXON_ID=420261 /ORGANISM="Thalassiosira antarctica, Strain CCMP982" /LENGTH=321 /DNA_ID=CAMNT_0048426011 /DNA_START=141 /DNA_END=1106 /DNA_ORIENTATION=+
MAFYQRMSKLALAPAGAAAAASATSILLGGSCRCYTSSTTIQKLNQVASQKLNTIIAKKTVSFTTFPSRATGYQQRKFSSSGGTSSSSGTKTVKGGSSNNNNNKGFVEWYEGHLNSRPVTTKAITGSILWGVGDAVAQVAPTFFEKDDNTNGNDTDEPSSSSVVMATQKKEFKYDLIRTARAVIFGFVIHAPLSHLHFNFLEWMTVRGGFQGLRIPVFKTIMEQFVYWSWISNSLYHGAMGAMQGMNLTQMYDRIADVLWDTQVAQWAFWIPVQLLNFQFVPVRHQLNVVLLTSIAWTALLSAWYPPEEEKKDEEENKSNE